MTPYKAHNITSGLSNEKNPGRRKLLGMAGSIRRAPNIYDGTNGDICIQGDQQCLLRSNLFCPPYISIEHSMRQGVDVGVPRLEATRTKLLHRPKGRGIRRTKQAPFAS